MRSKNFQNLVIGIIACISIIALIVACLTFNKSQQSNEYYKNLGPNHTHGQCVVSDKESIIFILIPKNGSTLLRNYIKNNHEGSERHYFDLSKQQKKYTTFCIIRDPEKRFRSGIKEIIKRNNESSLDKYNITLSIENMVDEHIVKQAEFIKNIRIDYYFPMIYLKYLNLQHINAVPDGDSASRIDKIIKSKNIDFNEIKNIYEEDYLLYNNSLKENYHNLLNLLKIKET